MNPPTRKQSQSIFYRCTLSTRNRLIIETDYFGGIGTQSGILYENGNISIPLCSGEESITIFINSLVEEENDEDGEA